LQFATRKSVRRGKIEHELPSFTVSTQRSRKSLKIRQSAKSRPTHQPMTRIGISVDFDFSGVFRMLQSTSFKNEMVWAWVLFTAFFVVSPCLAQEETLQESDSKAQPSVFERMFGSSSASAPKPKPKVPATPVAGKPTRSGFLVPLKSFTKVFRGPSEAEFNEEYAEETAPPRQTSTRTPREPFKSLPRTQERRERDYVDLRVEQIAPEPSRLSVPNSGPAPIVRADKLNNASERALSSASTQRNNPAVLKQTPVTAGNSKKPSSDIVIESSSTSRRTALEMETSDTNAGDRNVAPQTKRNAYSTGTTGSPKPVSKAATSNRLESKSLVDLGQPTDRIPSNLVKTTNSEKANAEVGAKTPDGMTRLIPQNEVPRPAKPASSSTNTSAIPSIPSTIPASANSAAFSREMKVPGVKVTVNGPSSILVNEEGRYEVVAKNEGTESLNGLIVRVAVPSQVTLGNVAVSDGVAHPDNDKDGNTIIWELEQIPAGGSKNAVLMLKTAKAEHFALGIEWTGLPQNAEMKIEVQQPQLALALEGPSEVHFGKPQMYRIRVRNTGNADVRAVSVALTAEPYGSNQSEIGDIAAGTERIVEVELTFQQSGVLPIVATAGSALSKVDARSAIDVLVKQSELVAAWYGPTEFYQGSEIDYELELSNTGSIAALATNCMMKLPPGTDVVSLPPGATRNGDQIKWEIRKLDPQEKQVFPIRVSFSKLGDNQIVFTGECSSSTTTRAEFKTNIDSIADLHLTVSDPVAPAPVGQPVVYEVVIANRGKKSANDIEVIAQFSDGIEPVRMEGHAGRIVPGQAIFNSIQSIGPNDKLVLRIHAEASKPGVHRFRVEVKSKGSDTDLLEEESTRYLATSVKSDRR
jgi:hypothetical protein